MGVIPRTSLYYCWYRDGPRWLNHPGPCETPLPTHLPSSLSHYIRYILFKVRTSQRFSFLRTRVHLHLPSDHYSFFSKLLILVTYFFFMVLLGAIHYGVNAADSASRAQSEREWSECLLLEHRRDEPDYSLCKLDSPDGIFWHFVYLTLSGTAGTFMCLALGCTWDFRNSWRVKPSAQLPAMRDDMYIQVDRPPK